MSAFQDMFNVKGKVVLVTGGGKGIGKMIAAGYVSAGCTVYISSRDAASLNSTATALTASGPGVCYSIPADLSTVLGVESVVAELTKREKCLHVLVNNSGANWGAPLEEYPDQVRASSVWDAASDGLANISAGLYVDAEIGPVDAGFVASE
ncbi:hypothetical protein P7C70_g9455, partial [Phenoliferia sp. Uapishka_3]